MVHYSLYYRLYGEGLQADALPELAAEPVATTCFPHVLIPIGLLCELELATTCFSPTLVSLGPLREELADVEVCIIHKLLVARPH